MTYGMNPLIGMKCDDEAIANCTWTDGSVVDYQNFPGGSIQFALNLFSQCRIHLYHLFHSNPFQHLYHLLQECPFSLTEAACVSDPMMRCGEKIRSWLIDAHQADNASHLMLVSTTPPTIPSINVNRGWWYDIFANLSRKRFSRTLGLNYRGCFLVFIPEGYT